MKKIALHGLQLEEHSYKYFNQIIDKLQKENCEIFLSKSFHERNPFLKEKKIPILNNVDQDISAFFSLGGDGTFLETVLLVGSLEIPILGINMGRLGFLAAISKEYVKESLFLFFNGEYNIEPRSMVLLENPKNLFQGKPYALNECAILRRDTSSMIKIRSYINNHYLNTYWADGLMVSTPTGSTGYSLSCGGPLMMPDSKDFVITPISPHNLNVRPLIVSDESELRFQIESRSNNFLVSLDSRSEPIEDTLEITVKKAQFNANIIRVKSISFPDTIRNKLSWGLDKRN